MDSPGIWVCNTLGCLFMVHGLSNIPIFEDDVLFYFAWRVHLSDNRVVLETKTQKVEEV